MLRAMFVATVAWCVLAFLPVEPAADPQPVNLVNGIGLIDYTRKPNLPIGSWVKYRITGSSELGMVDDYTVTVLIAGEEHFWGEDCFWVETWTQPKAGAPSSIATLMSYAIFDDSLALINMQLYARKNISELNEDGSPIQAVTKRNTSSLKNRKIGENNSFDMDTLGTETVTVPRGTYECKKISIRQGIGTTTDVGDSTFRTEVLESRVSYTSDQVPMTGIVREDIDYGIKRKTWKIGRSQEGGPMRVMERSKGSGELIDFGIGLTPQIVPEKYRKKLADYRPSSSTRPAPAKTRTTRRKTS